MQGAAGGGGKHERGAAVSSASLKAESAPSPLSPSACQQEEVGGRQAGSLFSISGVWGEDPQVTKQEEHG